MEGAIGGEKRGAAAADDHPRGHARSRGGLVSLGQSLAAESRARQETDGEGGGKGMEWGQVRETRAEGERGEWR